MPKLENRFYCYVLFDWLGVPRYVGKGVNNRWLAHEKESDPSNQAKNEFIEQTWVMLGEVPKIKIHENLTDAEACLTEIALISAIGRQDKESGPLVNLTDGGDGTSGRPTSLLTRAIISKKARGRKITEETRAKLRVGRSGRRPFLGHTHTEETRARMRATRLGKPRPTLLGRKYSPEHRAKIGDAQRGRPRTVEARLNISRGLKGRTLSNEHRRKLKDTMWITNGVSNRRIRDNVEMPEGWRRGFITKRTPPRRLT